MAFQSGHRAAHFTVRRFAAKTITDVEKIYRVSDDLSSA